MTQEGVYYFSAYHTADDTTAYENTKVRIVVDGQEACETFSYRPKDQVYQDLANSKFYFNQGDKET